MHCVNRSNRALFTPGLTWPCGASSKAQEAPDQQREQVQMTEPVPSDVSDVPSDSQMEDAESPTSKQVPKMTRQPNVASNLWVFFAGLMMFLEMDLFHDVSFIACLWSVEPVSC